MPTPAVLARARTTPDETALRDDRGALSWTDFAAAVRRAAWAMLATAPDPQERVAMLGENAVPTLACYIADLTHPVTGIASKPDGRPTSHPSETRLS